MPCACRSIRSALAARGIGIDDVATALQRGNTNLPVGTLYGIHQNLTVQANGQLTNAEEYRQLIVAYRNGAPVALRDLGDVVDSVENNRLASRYNGQQVVTLTIQRQPGTNTVAVVDAIRNLLPAFRQQLPASIKLDVLYDRSESIRESVNDVQFSLLLAIGLVVLVIFLFLRNLRATFIPTLALPTSIVFTFAIMYLLGFSLDNLSLMALTLSVGFVVDDAVVMLENIVRRMEEGEGAMEAALKGSREIGFTIVSMTVSLVAVFIPVLFLSGILGPLVSRIRDHHQCRHPRVRFRLAQPDADALQPSVESSEPSTRRWRRRFCGRGCGRTAAPPHGGLQHGRFWQSD